MALLSRSRGRPGVLIPGILGGGGGVAGSIGRGGAIRGPTSRHRPSLYIRTGLNARVSLCRRLKGAHASCSTVGIFKGTGKIIAGSVAMILYSLP